MALQPNELNQLNVVSFQTNFSRMPNVNFFCQQVTIPALSIGLAAQPTPFSDIAIEGDKIDFEQLNINFYVSEDLSNYLEIYNWIISLGFPDNPPQFNLQNDITTTANGSTTLKSDMSVVIQTNKSNPNFNITFKDAFPVSLGSIGLDSSATSLEPISVEATFAYTGSFSIEKIT